jgi:hypothetical protein
MASRGTRAVKAGTNRTSVRRAFAPIHTRALGAAVSVVGGVAVFAVTIFHVVLNPRPAFELGLLAQYFPGYKVSWMGALVGLFWGCLVGFVTGWFVAFVRNTVIAFRLFTIRTKAELAQTKNLLDDI